MREFRHATFRELRVPDSGYPHYKPQTIAFADATFDHCTFANCVLASVRQPSQCHNLRNVVLNDSIITNSSIYTAALEEVVINTLSIQGGGRINHFTVEGATFRHVTITGPVTGRLQLNPGPDSTMFLLARNDPTYEPAWQNFYRDFYRDLDWALDISQAVFATSPWMDFLPGRLVRRNPETQLLVRRDRLLGFDIKRVPWKAGTGAQLQIFLERGLFDDLVVLAATSSRKWKEELEDIRMLRHLGLADPD